MITKPSLQILEVASSSGLVPAALWMPAATPRGLLLACHGGSGHKASPGILAIVERMTALDFAVAAIDGPVHGGRRTDGSLDPIAAKTDFRQAWRSGIGRYTMADDFAALLSFVKSMPALAGVPVAYIGVSMGTAYGIPLLAQETEICGAAIGLWTTTYPASEHLAECAKAIRCPTWFTLQWDDEFFEREGGVALYEAIGAQDKRLVVYPGPHIELQGDRLDDALAFVQRCFARKLAAS